VAVTIQVQVFWVVTHCGVAALQPRRPGLQGGIVYASSHERFTNPVWSAEVFGVYFSLRTLQGLWNTRCANYAASSRFSPPPARFQLFSFRTVAVFCSPRSDSAAASTEMFIPFRNIDPRFWTFPRSLSAAPPPPFV